MRVWRKERGEVNIVIKNLGKRKAQGPKVKHGILMPALKKLK